MTRTVELALLTTLLVILLLAAFYWFGVPLSGSGANSGASVLSVPSGRVANGGLGQAR